MRSIRLTPDTLRLEVGGRVTFLDFAAIGLDSTGTPVPGFAPRFAIANQDVARFDGPGIIGLSVGRTTLTAQSVTPAEEPTPPVRTRAEILIVVVAATTTLARAATDSVPRDLVLALLSAGMRAPVLRVGAAADGLPASLSAGWEVMGSSSWGSTSTSVFRARYMSRAALDTLERRFVADGWTKPVIAGRMERGFVASGTPYAAPGRCRNGSYLTYSASSRVPNEATIVLVLNARGSLCNATSLRTMTFMDSIPVPTLRPPGNVAIENGSGTGGDRDHWTSSATARGSVPVAELASHYAAQIEEQGWTQADHALSLTVATRTYRRTLDGREWFGVLSITSPSNATGADLTFTVRAIR